MGDRFYQQQYGVTMGALANPVRPRATLSKKELADSIGISGIDKLTVVDLHKLRLVSAKSLEQPTGRLKKPYLLEVNKLNDDIDWSKLTVATLKLVISAYNIT